MREPENVPDEAPEETVDLDLADASAEAGLDTEATDADATTRDDDATTSSERPSDPGSETGVVSGMRTTDLRPGQRRTDAARRERGRGRRVRARTARVARGAERDPRGPPPRPTRRRAPGDA